MTGGWSTFRAENGLRVGDEVKFEYEPASSGEAPSLRITLVSRGNTNEAAQKMQARLAAKRGTAAADGDKAPCGSAPRQPGKRAGQEAGRAMLAARGPGAVARAQQGGQHAQQQRQQQPQGARQSSRHRRARAPHFYYVSESNSSDDDDSDGSEQSAPPPKRRRAGSPAALQPPPHAAAGSATLARGGGAQAPAGGAISEGTCVLLVSLHTEC